MTRKQSTYCFHVFSRAKHGSADHGNPNIPVSPLHVRWASERKEALVRSRSDAFNFLRDLGAKTTMEMNINSRKGTDERIERTRWTELPSDPIAGESVTYD